MAPEEKQINEPDHFTDCEFKRLTETFSLNLLTEQVWKRFFLSQSLSTSQKI